MSVREAVWGSHRARRDALEYIDVVLGGPAAAMPGSADGRVRQSLAADPAARSDDAPVLIRCLGCRATFWSDDPHPPCFCVDEDQEIVEPLGVPVEDWVRQQEGARVDNFGKGLEAAALGASAGAVVGATVAAKVGPWWLVPIGVVAGGWLGGVAGVLVSLAR